MYSAYSDDDEQLHSYNDESDIEIISHSNDHIKDRSFEENIDTFFGREAAI